MVEWMNRSGEIVDGRGTYQIKKIRAAIEICKAHNRGAMAIDIGAHVGFWSMHLVNSFTYVYAFEPIPMHRECFVQNVESPYCMLMPYALGAENGDAWLTIPDGSSGGTHVSDDGNIHAEMRTLDSLQFASCDFIKIDVEGFELDVLRGADETIRKFWPIICVEQKPHTPGGKKHIGGGSSRPAVDHLVGMGYSINQELSGDFIMVRP